MFDIGVDRIKFTRCPSILRPDFGKGNENGFGYTWFDEVTRMTGIDWRHKEYVCLPQ